MATSRITDSKVKGLFFCRVAKNSWGGSFVGRPVGRGPFTARTERCRRVYGVQISWWNNFDDGYDNIFG